MIKEGAKLVEAIEDIIEELGPIKNDVSAAEPEETEPVLTGGEKLVFECISPGEKIHIDEIIRNIPLETAEISSLLTMIELKGLVSRLAGNFYIRN